MTTNISFKSSKKLHQQSHLHSYINQSNIDQSNKPIKNKKIHFNPSNIEFQQKVNQLKSILNQDSLKRKNIHHSNKSTIISFTAKHKISESFTNKNKKNNPKYQQYQKHPIQSFNQMKQYSQNTYQKFSHPQNRKQSSKSLCSQSYFQSMQNRLLKFKHITPTNLQPQTTNNQIQTFEDFIDQTQQIPYKEKDQTQLSEKIQYTLSENEQIGLFEKILQKKINRNSSLLSEFSLGQNNNLKPIIQKIKSTEKFSTFINRNKSSNKKNSLISFSFLLSKNNTKNRPSLIVSDKDQYKNWLMIKKRQLKKKQLSSGQKQKRIQMIDLKKQNMNRNKSKQVVFKHIEKNNNIMSFEQKFKIKRSLSCLTCQDRNVFRNINKNKQNIVLNRQNDSQVKNNSKVLQDYQNKKQINNEFFEQKSSLKNIINKDNKKVNKFQSDKNFNLSSQLNRDVLIFQAERSKQRNIKNFKYNLLQNLKNEYLLNKQSNQKKIKQKNKIKKQWSYEKSQPSYQLNEIYRKYEIQQLTLRLKDQLKKITASIKKNKKLSSQKKDRSSTKKQISARNDKKQIIKSQNRIKENKILYDLNDQALLFEDQSVKKQNQQESKIGMNDKLRFDNQFQVRSNRTEGVQSLEQKISTEIKFDNDDLNELKIRILDQSQQRRQTSIITAQQIIYFDDCEFDSPLVKQSLKMSQSALAKQLIKIQSITQFNKNKVQIVQNHNHQQKLNCQQKQQIISSNLIQSQFSKLNIILKTQQLIKNQTILQIQQIFHVNTLSQLRKNQNNQMHHYDKHIHDLVNRQTNLYNKDFHQEPVHQKQQICQRQLRQQREIFVDLSYKQNDINTRQNRFNITLKSQNIRNNCEKLINYQNEQFQNLSLIFSNLLIQAAYLFGSQNTNCNINESQNKETFIAKGQKCMIKDNLNAIKNKNIINEKESFLLENISLPLGIDSITLLKMMRNNQINYRTQINHQYQPEQILNLSPQLQKLQKQQKSQLQINDQWNSMDKSQYNGSQMNEQGLNQEQQQINQQLCQKDDVNRQIISPQVYFQIQSLISFTLNSLPINFTSEQITNQFKQIPTHQLCFQVTNNMISNLQQFCINIQAIYKKTKITYNQPIIQTKNQINYPIPFQDQIKQPSNQQIIAPQKHLIKELQQNNQLSQFYQSYLKQFLLSVYDITNVFLDELRPFGSKGISPFNLQLPKNYLKNNTNNNYKQHQILKNVQTITKFVKQKIENQIFSIKLGLILQKNDLNFVNIEQNKQQISKLIKKNLQKQSKLINQQLDTQYSYLEDVRFQIFYQLLISVQKEILQKETFKLYSVFLNKQTIY